MDRNLTVHLASPPSTEKQHGSDSPSVFPPGSQRSGTGRSRLWMLCFPSVGCQRQAWIWLHRGEQLLARETGPVQVPVGQHQHGGIAVNPKE